MSVDVLEVDAASAVMVIDLVLLGLTWVSPIRKIARAYALEDRVELSVVDQEGVMLLRDVVPVHIIKVGSFEWQKAAPAHAGFAPDIEARLDQLIADRRVWGLHGVLVVRGRHIVLERYFE